MANTVTMIGASWCRPCASVRPLAESLSTEYNATFEYIDVESGDPRAEGITAVPLLRLTNGDTGITHEHTGAASADLLRWMFDLVFG